MASYILPDLLSMQRLPQPSYFRFVRHPICFPCVVALLYGPFPTKGLFLYSKPHYFRLASAMFFLFSKKTLKLRYFLLGPGSGIIYPLLQAVLNSRGDAQQRR